MGEGHPDVVAVRDLAALVYTGKAEGQTLVVLDLFGVDLVHVEGRVGHDVVEWRLSLVGVFVVADGLLDVPLEPMDREVHLGQAERLRLLFHPVEGQAFVGIGIHCLDEVGGLNEHAARPAGRVDDLAAGGLDDVDDGFNDADRREELTVVVGFLVGELGQEVFVDPAKDVPVCLLQGRIIRDPQNLTQRIFVKLGVFLFLRKAFDSGVIFLDGLHRGDDGDRCCLAFQKTDQVVELSVLPQKN